MRADRLISLMLLLQRAGPITGAGIAGELGVSVRTVYRDIDALGRIGIPVVATSGPHGGYSLVEGYWNDFARLTTEETNALIAAASSNPLTAIGLGTTLRRALEKLAAQRSGARQPVRTATLDPERILIDHSGSTPDTTGSVLQQLAACIAQNRPARISTSGGGFYPLATTLQVDPLGLVLNEGAWHLVYRFREIRVLGVDSLAAVEPLPDRFVPPELDLAAFWAEWCASRETYRTRYRVLIAVPEDAVDSVVRYLGGGSAMVMLRNQPGAVVPIEEWLQVEVGFLSYQDARARILGLGGAARVISPPELVLGILDYARQTMSLYEG